MKCTQPFLTTRHAFGCGQCMPCRFNRRRTWAHRLMLETLDHEGRSNFVTLTYAPRADGADQYQLVPKHTQDWLKRLRKHMDPRKLRYYLVGEYGDRSQRPHYHAALYGLDPCFGGPVRDGVCQCVTCSAVRETWGFGHVHVAELNIKTASYLCGYVTKKMTHRNDPRLYGREPEFARMSLRPGIGAGVMHDAASAMMRHNLEDRHVDVPHALSWGGRDLPLGRYLRTKLRTYVGRDEKAPAQSLAQAEAELQAVRSFAWANEISTKQAFTQLNEQFARNLAAREILKGKKL